MEPEKIPGVVYQNRGTALDYRLYEGDEGHVYNYEWNRAIKIGMGEIKEIQENEMVASIGPLTVLYSLPKHTMAVYILGILKMKNTQTLRSKFYTQQSKLSEAEGQDLSKRIWKSNFLK